MELLRPPGIASEVSQVTFGLRERIRCNPDFENLAVALRFWVEKDSASKTAQCESSTRRSMRRGKEPPPMCAPKALVSAHLARLGRLPFLVTHVAQHGQGLGSTAMSTTCQALLMRAITERQRGCFRERKHRYGAFSAGVEIF